MSNLPPAVVYGLSATGLAIARALGRRGVPVFGVDRRRWEVGRFSRYVDWQPSLEAAHMACGSDPIHFVGGDPELMEMCKRSSSSILRTWNPDCALEMLDKGRQYHSCLSVADEVGFQIPRTWVPETWTDWSELSVSNPVVIKPRYGAASTVRPARGKLWVCSLLR